MFGLFGSSKGKRIKPFSDARVLAAGLARRPERFCVAAAAEISVATLDASRRKSVFASATTTTLLLLTAVRTLLETSKQTLEEDSPSPFVALFASLVSRADAETATSAKRALFSDASLFFKSDDVVAALAAASVDECVSTHTATRACVSTQSTPSADHQKVALDKLAAFFSDARASRRRARSEAAAFKELRRRFSFRTESQEDNDKDDDGNSARRRLPTFLRLFGAACASATRTRLRLCASARRVSASRRKDVVAAAEGLKFWVAATEALGTTDLPDDDDEKYVVARQTATIAAFLPLALEAIVPSSSFEEEEDEDEEEDEREESFRGKTKEEDDDAEKASELRALASAAKTMVTSLAGAAPSAFRAAVAALRPESTARLRAAMARDTVRDVTREHPKEKGHRARASVEDRTSTPLPPPPPSFAAFTAPNDH